MTGTAARINRGTVGVSLAALWLLQLATSVPAMAEEGEAHDLPSLELLEYLGSMAERDGELLGPEALADEVYAVLDDRPDERAAAQNETNTLTAETAHER